MLGPLSSDCLWTAHIEVQPPIVCVLRMRPTLMSATIDDDARGHSTPLACRARDDAAVRQGEASPSDGVVLEMEGVGCTYFHKDKFLPQLR